MFVRTGSPVKMNLNVKCKGCENKCDVNKKKKCKKKLDK